MTKKTEDKSNVESNVKKDKRLANLKPFKKGHKLAQGRKVGSRNLKTLLTEAMSKLTVAYVEQHNKKNPKKNHITIDDVDIELDIAMQYIKLCRDKGDLKGIQDLFDRIHGKATSRLELTGANGGAIQIEKKEEAKKKAKELMSKWFPEEK